MATGTGKNKCLKYQRDVQQAINAMEQAKMSNSAMREALGRLRECMEYAVGNQLISVNPCLIVEVPWTFKKVKEEIALTQTEQNALLDEVEDSWYKEMFYFMCLTEVRVGELGGLKWEDIDFKRKVISIQRSLSCSYYNGVKRELLVTPKTINSMREMPFIGEMEDILQSQKKKQIQLKKELGSRWRSKEEFENLMISAMVMVSVSETWTFVYFLIHLCSVELLIPYSLHICVLLFPDSYKLTMLCLNSSVYLVFSMSFSPFFIIIPSFAFCCLFF